MNRRPTISERNAANSRAAVEQFEKAVIARNDESWNSHLYETSFASLRVEGQYEFSRAVLLELLGAK